MRKYESTQTDRVWTKMLCPTFGCQTAPRQRSKLTTFISELTNSKTGDIHYVATVECMRCFYSKKLYQHGHEFQSLVGDDE